MARTEGQPDLAGTSTPRPAGTSGTVVAADGGSIEVAVDLKGHVTKEKELARIEREIAKASKEIATIDKTLAAKGFLDRAPKEVVDEKNAQRAAFIEAQGRLEAAKKLAEELA